MQFAPLLLACCEYIRVVYVNKSTFNCCNAIEVEQHPYAVGLATEVFVILAYVLAILLVFIMHNTFFPIIIPVECF